MARPSTVAFAAILTLSIGALEARAQRSRGRTGAEERKSVLLLSLERGYGQVAASEALHRALIGLQVSHPHSAGIRVQHLDILGLLDADTRQHWRAHDLQNTLASTREGADSLWKSSSPEKMRASIPQLAERLTPAALKRLSADVVVSSWPPVAYLIEHLQEQGKIPSTVRSVFVAADLALTGAANVPGLAMIADPGLAADYQRAGGRSSAVTLALPALPSKEEFATQVPAEEARRRLGLDPRVPVVVVTGGGWGMALDSLLEHLKTVAPAEPVQLVLIHGKRPDLTDKFERLRLGGLHPHLKLVNIGFTTSMSLYMDAADAFVSRPGGSTIAELSAKGRGLLYFGEVFGLAERNARHLEERGAAHPVSLSELTDLSRLRALTRSTSEAMRQLYPPAAAARSARMAAEKITDYAHGRPLTGHSCRVVFRP